MVSWADGESSTGTGIRLYAELWVLLQLTFFRSQARTLLMWRCRHR